MDLSRRVKIRPASAILLAMLLAAACYANTLRNEFVFDDLEIVVRNPLVTGQDAATTRIFTSHYWSHVTPAGDLYRPLTILTYRANYLVGGLAPAGFHLVNLALHALCTGLVVALSMRLRLTPAASLLAGALFAAHPIHTEAVAEVVGRADLLAAAFVLGGWLVHLASSRPSAARAAAVSLLFLAGLLSKENAIVLPGLLLAGDLWRIQRRECAARDVVLPYAACAAVAAGWLALRAVLLEPVAAGSIAESLFAAAPVSHRVFTALDVIGRYLVLLVAPLRLSADYSFAQIPLVTSAAHLPTLVSAAALLGLLAAGIYRLLRGAVDGLAAVAFLMALAPVSNLIVPIGTIIAERLLYLPSAAFCLAVPAVWLAITRGRPSRRPGLLTGVSLLILGLYTARTVTRNTEWKDQITLFTATAATSPNSAKVHYNLAVALEEAGRDGEALAEYQAALAIRPDDPRSLHNAGLLLAKEGRLSDAASHLTRAAALDETIPGLLGSLGAVLSREGRSAEAEAVLRRALVREPASHLVLYNLGTLLLSQDRRPEAVALLERARDADPADPDGRLQLGTAYLKDGRPSQAVTEIRAALQSSPELAEAHLQMALALLALGDRPQARQAAERARSYGVSLPPSLQELVLSTSPPS